MHKRREGKEWNALYDAREGTRHAYNAWNALLAFGSHALHVMHDNHVAHSISHVLEFTCLKIRSIKEITWLSGK